MQSLAKPKKITLTENPEPPSNTVVTKPKPPLKRLAFGSCNKTNLPQSHWSIITENNPDLWIWLGDIIYADTEDMSKMRAMYDAQKANAEYKKFVEKHSIIGIYDDHDYGENDGGKSYPKKEESKVELLDFLEVSKDNPVWGRAGAYQSYTYGEEGNRVKVILLDTRYFRDALREDTVGENRYLINKEGNLLGEAQWKWLENELTNSNAQVHLIGSSIQVIPTEHRFEKWSNFPKERNRFFKLLAKCNPSKTIILSGDRHISEVSKIKLKGMDNELFEITSSSLTHAYPKPEGEANKYRVGKLVDVNNFSLLTFDWQTDGVGVKTEIRGNGNVLLEEVILLGK